MYRCFWLLFVVGLLVSNSGWAVNDRLLAQPSNFGQGQGMRVLGSGVYTGVNEHSQNEHNAEIGQKGRFREQSDEFLRQEERDRIVRKQHEQIPDARLKEHQDPSVESTRLPENESPCFTIHHITTKENNFQWALAAASPKDDPALNRCLGANGINLIMKRVQNAIVARGFVTTRVLAEPQDLQSGTLMLTVMPGRIAAIRFAPGTTMRATLWNALPIRPGDILNLRDIEQGLENFRRVPTVDADIQIMPAENAGESDLVVSWKQRPVPLRIAASVDDSGSKGTGKYQGSVTLSGDNLFSLNDLLYVTYNHDLGGDAGGRGTDGYSAHYSLPWDYWLLGVTTSEYNFFQSVAGANQAYIYSGESHNSDVRLARVVYRDAVRKTTLGVRGWQRTSKNFIEDTEIQIQRRRMAGWELSASHREFIGSATLDATLAYKRGTGALAAMPAPEEAFDAGTSRPQILNADIQYNLPFAIGQEQLRYSPSVRAQWSEDALVPQDRFGIGGRYTVRGFDGENILSAERGVLLRNDLGFAIRDTGQEFYLGLDYGRVSGPSADFLIGQHLAGTVLGLRGGYKGFSYDVFAGRPLIKPSGFKTDRTTAGFSLNWNY